ncbi:hypothetical protein [Microvirga sp. M2]|uniref:hypothetical protein n=1 Tax=Microvirga sp. M2 TaxID=3073270 RepID=UPI0039C4E134
MKLEHWSELRSIGNSRIVQLAGIIPVVGYMILFNETLLELIKSSPFYVPSSIDLIESPHASFLDKLNSLRLYALYFGFFIIGIASLVYQWKCPSLVKKYADVDDFIIATTGFYRERDYLLAQKATIELGNNDTRQLDAAKAESQTTILRLYYDAEDRAQTDWRTLAGFCYGIGFVIVAVPSALAFLRICQSFWAALIRII